MSKIEVKRTGYRVQIQKQASSSLLILLSCRGCESSGQNSETEWRRHLRRSY